MFRPKSIFCASRKASCLRGHLSFAGYPVSEHDARSVVAQAWGWLSWADLLAALEMPGNPSPLDEDLIGSAVSAVMRDLNQSIVTDRGNRAFRTIHCVTGLPTAMCPSLAALVRFTGEHITDGVWRTPQQFREQYARCIRSGPDFFQEFFAEHRRATETRKFPLPPYRPRY